MQDSLPPATFAYYELLQECDRHSCVLDAAADRDHGVAVLARHFFDVRKPHECVEGEVDLAVFVDVLAEARDPRAALRDVRRSLKPGGRVFVAEPGAPSLTTLRPPQRRSFSPRSLAATSIRAGFDRVSWIDDAGSYLAAFAERSDDGSGVRLCDAIDALEERSLEGVDSALLAEIGACQDSGNSAVAFEALLLDAELSTELGDTKRAHSAYSRARALDPTDSRIWSGLSALALVEGDARIAWHLALEATTRGPHEVRPRVALALAAEALADPRELSLWVSATRLAPADLRLATRTARAAARCGDYATAINAFERVFAYDDPRDENFHLTFGWLLLMDHRIPEAVTRAKHATALAPQSAAVDELWQALVPALGVSSTEA